MMMSQEIWNLWPTSNTSAYAACESQDESMLALVRIDSRTIVGDKHQDDANTKHKSVLMRDTVINNRSIHVPRQIDLGKTQSQYDNIIKNGNVNRNKSTLTGMELVAHNNRCAARRCRNKPNDEDIVLRYNREVILRKTYVLIKRFLYNNDNVCWQQTNHYTQLSLSQMRSALIYKLPYKLYHNLMLMIELKTKNELTSWPIIPRIEIRYAQLNELYQRDIDSFHMKMCQRNRVDRHVNAQAYLEELYKRIYGFDMVYYEYFYYMSKYNAKPWARVFCMFLHTAWYFSPIDVAAQNHADHNYRCKENNTLRLSCMLNQQEAPSPKDTSPQLAQNLAPWQMNALLQKTKADRMKLELIEEQRKIDRLSGKRMDGRNTHKFDHIHDKEGSKASDQRKVTHSPEEMRQDMVNAQAAVDSQAPSTGSDTESETDHAIMSHMESRRDMFLSRDLNRDIQLLDQLVNNDWSQYRGQYLLFKGMLGPLSHTIQDLNDTFETEYESDEYGMPRNINSFTRYKTKYDVIETYIRFEDIRNTENIERFPYVGPMILLRMKRTIRSFFFLDTYVSNMEPVVEEVYIYLHLFHDISRLSYSDTVTDRKRLEGVVNRNQHVNFHAGDSITKNTIDVLLVYNKIHQETRKNLNWSWAESGFMDTWSKNTVRVSLWLIPVSLLGSHIAVQFSKSLLVACGAHASKLLALSLFTPLQTYATLTGNFTLHVNATEQKWTFLKWSTDAIESASDSLHIFTHHRILGITATSFVVSTFLAFNATKRWWIMKNGVKKEIDRRNTILCY